MSDTNMTNSDHAIEVFQDLDLTCAGETNALPSALERCVRAPWRHAPEVETMMAEATRAGAEKYLVFERTASEHVRAARLVLYRDKGIYRIANIVPTDERRGLGEIGYNDALNDFVDRVLKPCEADGLSVKLTKRRQKITDWTSVEAANALHVFSATANKTTGTSHPMDAERWRVFLIADHRAESNLSANNLERWLVEIEEWSAEEDRELIVKWEDARELLQHYDHIH